jgi:hypothetical protein
VNKTLLRLAGLGTLPLAGVVTFGPRGNTYYIEKGRCLSAEGSVTQWRIDVREYDAAVAKSPYRKICSKDGCWRPANAHQDYGGSGGFITTLYFCDGHWPPPKSVGVGYGSGYSNKGRPSSPEIDLNPFVTVLLWAATAVGFGFCALLTLAGVFSKGTGTDFPTPGMGLFFGLLALGIAGVVWLLAHWFAQFVAS